jgi:hypothetical protein
LQRTIHDYGNLSRYRDEDLKMTAPAAGENRVVFMGDSITDFWGRQRGKFFPGKPYVNRGISGQVTPQTQPLEEINDVFYRLRPGAVQGRVVLDLGQKAELAVAGATTPSGHKSA